MHYSLKKTHMKAAALQRIRMNRQDIAKTKPRQETRRKRNATLEEQYA